MQHLRDLGRRKVRTTLTILGITIGIWALVVFGSMANKINALVEGGSTYYADKLDAGRRFRRLAGRVRRRPDVDRTVADQVRDVDGVDVAFPVVMMLMDDQTSAMTMGVPPMINGGVAGADEGRETFELRYAQGRALDGRRRRRRTSPCSAPTSPASTTSRSATRSSSRACSSRSSGSSSRH